MFKILLAEDEINLNKILSSRLKKEGFEVYSALDGQEAYEVLLSKPIDLVVTDVMMPVVDGVALTKKVREVSSETPVIMLTALSELEDKVKGFEAGADDYLSKPFAFRELVLRIKALLRRYKKAFEGKLTVGGSVLDYGTMTFTEDGVEIPMGKKEFGILFLLLSSPGFIFSREQILSEIWGYDSETNDRTIDTHITWIRSKISGKDFEIVTARGLGYKAVLK